MSLEIKIPAVGESITSGLLSTWHKNDGDAVKAGEALFTLETDKVSTEIVAEKAGTLRVKVAAGAEVKIGEVVGAIEEGSAAKPEAAEPRPEIFSSASASLDIPISASKKKTYSTNFGSLRGKQSSERT